MHGGELPHGRVRLAPDLRGHVRDGLLGHRQLEQRHQHVEHVHRRELPHRRVWLAPDLRSFPSVNPADIVSMLPVAFCAAAVVRGRWAD